jgi:hypothetical protein
MWALVTDPWVARSLRHGCLLWKQAVADRGDATDSALTNLGVLSTESVLERTKFAARHRRGRFCGVWGN